MPIFLLKPFSNCLRKTWYKFLRGSPSKCWPNSMPVFVCIAIGKSGFLKKKSQNGRWPQLFFPQVCSLKKVLAEELKKSGCLCSKYLTFLLRNVYVNRLVWTLFLREKISIPVHFYRRLCGRPSPFWHDCSLCCALHRSHLKCNAFLSGSDFKCRFWYCLLALLTVFLPHYLP